MMYGHLIPKIRFQPTDWLTAEYQFAKKAFPRRLPVSGGMYL